jgi:hypothetical protein
VNTEIDAFVVIDPIAMAREQKSFSADVAG